MNEPVTPATARTEARSAASGAPVILTLARWCARTWLGLFEWPVRWLGSERVPSSATILCICHKPSFADAVILTAASPRPLACLVPRRQLRGFQPLLASSLGMITYDSEPSRWHSALRSCTEALASGRIVAGFEVGEPEDAGAERQTSLGLARQAWSGAFPGVQPFVLRVHRFRPPGRSQEFLIHVSETVGVDEVGDAARLGQDEALLQGRRGENVFAMDPSILNRLLGDFEDALRNQLREEWERGRGRKQTAEGFRLSPRAAATLRLANQAEPEILLELRQLRDAEREARRMSSLAELRGQLGRKQFSSVWRLLTWIETILGFPIALYGALNHLLAGLLVAGSKFIRGNNKADSATLWVPAVVVLACYASQIVLADRLLGRAFAGYYAVTLPVSGAYLWRYWWLLRRRTRILLLGARAKTLQAVAERNRKRFLGKLTDILNRGVGPPGIASLP